MWFVTEGEPLGGDRLRAWLVSDGRMRVDPDADGSTWVATWEGYPHLELVWQHPDEGDLDDGSSGLEAVLSLPADETGRLGVQKFVDDLCAAFDLRATEPW